MSVMAPSRARLDSAGRLESERSAREHLGARTCVGCRRRDDRSALLRVVAVMDPAGVLTLVADPRSRRPGRGAWLHPGSGCLRKAVDRRMFGRALRLTAAPDATALTDWIAEYEHTSTTAPAKAAGVDRRKRV